MELLTKIASKDFKYELRLRYKFLREIIFERCLARFTFPDLMPCLG